MTESKLNRNNRLQIFIYCKINIYKAGISINFKKLHKKLLVKLILKITLLTVKFYILYYMVFIKDKISVALFAGLAFSKVFIIIPCSSIT